MRPKVLLHAVVRYDESAHLASIDESITVVAVVPTKEEAVREVNRLNQLKAERPCRYFWTPARYYPEGRGVATAEEPGED
jgi:hypothetical protein